LNNSRVTNSRFSRHQWRRSSSRSRE